MKRIESITIVKEPDTDSTPDYLGTYSETPADGAIDRKKHLWQRGQFRYFNPARAESPEDAKSDYWRAESFNNGEWSFIGVRAVATIQTSDDEGRTWLSNQLGSAGLWGVESDSDDSYIASIGEEEREALAGALLELGFSQDEIDRA